MFSCTAFAIEDGIVRLSWCAFAFWAFCYLKPYIPTLLIRMRSVKLFGIEIPLLDDELKAAAFQHNLSLTRKDTAGLSSRLRLVGQEIVGMSILWVDDFPANNNLEAQILKRFGARIRFVKTSETALNATSTETFDLVISDMKRGNNDLAGMELLERLRASGEKTRMIIYTGTDQSTFSCPVGLFGITNRPDELVHLILDARERELA